VEEIGEIQRLTFTGVLGFDNNLKIIVFRQHIHIHLNYFFTVISSESSTKKK